MGRFPMPSTVNSLTEELIARALNYQPLLYYILLVSVPFSSNVP